MSESMLDFTKSVLEGVSFNKNLFCKELQKATEILLPNELEELIAWLTKYVVKYPELNQCILRIPTWI